MSDHIHAHLDKVDIVRNDVIRGQHGAGRQRPMISGIDSTPLEGEVQDQRVQASRKLVHNPIKNRPIE